MMSQSEFKKYKESITQVSDELWTWFSTTFKFDIYSLSVNDINIVVSAYRTQDLEGIERLVTLRRPHMGES